MTETEYVVSGFARRFEPFRGRRVVLHGSRDYAREIIRRHGETFRFAGVMSRDPLDGADFCGIPVLREADLAVLEPDLLILTERVRHAEAVYRDLHGICEEKGIRLYNMYGLDEIAAHRELAECGPMDLDGWKELCGRYQLVAFEAMDTLLIGRDLVMRDTFRRLIVWLFDRGIEVRVSLRRSFPAEAQAAALKASGLFADPDARFVVRQGEDLSFRTLREENPGKKILYIGNGLVNECLLPRCYGIDTWRYNEYYAGIGVPVLRGKLPRIPYDAGARERIRRAIDESAVVSFDVFDTLIVRKTLRPDDVFELAERRAKAQGIPADGFAAARGEAQRAAGCGTIHDIYERLRGRFGWSAETTRSMLRLELAIEDEVTVPRAGVTELMDYAVAAGKTVVLVSDMYLTEPLLRGLLKKKGISACDRLFVSCERRLSKNAGLFGEVCRLAPRPELILHLGDDPEADCGAAASYGIRTEQIFSAVALAAARGWAESIRTAETLTERCLVGSTIAALFRDPFQNPNLLELPHEERLRRFAAGVVGPLAVSHMSWLLEKLREKNYDGVLFLSRDGYLPFRIYQGLASVSALTPALYYYANRHSAFLCCCDDPARTPSVVSRGNFYGLSAEHLLRSVYNLPEEALLPPFGGETKEAYINRHMPLIREQAQRAREANLLYAGRCGIRPGGTYALVDFIAVGNTQQYLESFLSCRLEGFYFGNYAPGEREKLEVGSIEDYMHVENRTLIRNFFEIETYLLSPEPPVDHIAPDGSVVFGDEPRTPEELRSFGLVFSGALAYARDFFRLLRQGAEPVCPKLPEEMFAAEGFHGVEGSLYDDWPKVKIPTQTWQA